MSACLKCGREDAAYPFHVLEVQTLHVRDFGGEKRVQALGLFQDYAICRECAAARLAAVKSPRKRLLLSGAAFGAIFLLGAALTAFYLRASGPGGAMRLLGFAGLVCGALGSIPASRAPAPCGRNTPPSPRRRRWSGPPGSAFWRPPPRNIPIPTSPTSRSTKRPSP